MGSEVGAIVTSATTERVVGIAERIQTSKVGTTLADLIDRTGRRIDREQPLRPGSSPQALGVAGAIPGEVEVGDAVVSVAEHAVDRIDVVDLGVGAVADKQMTGCRVVDDSLGIGATERRSAEPATRRRRRYRGCRRAPSSMTEILSLSSSEMKSRRLPDESEVRGLPVVLGSQGSAAESRAAWGVAVNRLKPW